MIIPCGMTIHFTNDYKESIASDLSCAISMYAFDHVIMVKFPILPP